MSFFALSDSEKERECRKNFVMVKNRRTGGEDMNTALRAEETKAMIFISEAHEKFYYEKLKEVRC